MSLDVINARLDLVSQFLLDETLREKITALLRRTYDSQRLVQKFSMGRGDPEDLICLLRTIEATNEVASTLEKQVSIVESESPERSTENTLLSAKSLVELYRRLSLEGPRTLACCISDAIDEEGLMRSRRVDDSNSAELVTLAQGVLLDEGTLDDQGSLSPVLRSITTPKPPKGEKNVEEEVWIMRKRSVLGPQASLQFT
jgi:DNA mismatch repair ATPase MutS